MSYYKLSWSGRRSVIRFSGFVCPSTAWNLYFHIPLILSCQDLSDVGQCLMFVNRSDLKSIDGFLTSRTGATRCSNINNLRGSYEGRILKNWGVFFFFNLSRASRVFLHHYSSLLYHTFTLVVDLNGFGVRLSVLYLGSCFDFQFRLNVFLDFWFCLRSAVYFRFFPPFCTVEIASWRIKPFDIFFFFFLYIYSLPLLHTISNPQSAA